MKLAKYTNDTKWKIRAYQFAVLSFDDDIIHIIKTHGNSEKNKVSGVVSELPFSLMQGIGGDIILYSDLIDGAG